MEQHTIEIKFRGERLARTTDEVSTNTLYRHADGRLMVHMHEGHQAWLEDGHGDGLEEWQVRRLFPELASGLDA